MTHIEIASLASKNTGASSTPETNLQHPPSVERGMLVRLTPEVFILPDGTLRPKADNLAEYVYLVMNTFNGAVQAVALHLSGGDQRTVYSRIDASAQFPRDTELAHVISDEEAAKILGIPVESLNARLPDILNPIQRAHADDPEP